MDFLPGARGLINYIKDNLSIIILLSAAFLAALIFVWQAVAARTYVSPAEQSAILNMLFICDTIFLTISVVIALLILYLSSLSGGSLKEISYDTYAVFIIFLIAPLVFIGCMMAYKPPGLYQYSVSVSGLLSVMSLLTAVMLVLYAIRSVQPQVRVRRLIERICQEFRQSGAAGSTASIAMQQPLVSSTTISLISLLKKLSVAGDTSVVNAAVDSMASIALGVTGRASIKDLALARSMVCDIVETGAIGAEARNPGVVCHSIDRLREITVMSRRIEISSMAFRGIGYVASACIKFGDCVRASVFDPWLARVYTTIYDSMGRREALDKAVQVVERALARKDELMPEEKSHLLFVAGHVYTRLAKADKSADKALLSISLLEQAQNTGEPGVLDRALINAEVGRAYVVLASSRNPVKSYKKALAAFEEAGKILTEALSPWDASSLEADTGNACVLLADEYYRLRRYDDALASARGAIEHYTVAARFFTPRRSKELHGKIMSDAGLAHTVISEIFLRSHELDNALKHASMAISCYNSSIGMIDREYAPEAYASMKVSIGLAYASMSEICFKEKRYEEAISACDSAIQAYNEAVKLYEGAGKEKLAADVRKRLKQASDLFNTFMMIGKGKTKSISLTEDVL
ncbi:tetratricopeptide repeat protein [Methanocella arvoryzae]|uniref:Uncharacterized protein n=1 Tax=Methanocella arvoryzae (strain DSM 22066 / NBRC 105507 / MRE50) TaxID=351160 RepID=Q0W1D1_METAR|nr:hypothetical protein [Methanocella arvoryzae]CAJ37812.1 hypothetical protein RRC20 [Methanocella arvoryzae MRE50]